MTEQNAATMSLSSSVLEKDKSKISIHDDDFSFKAVLPEKRKIEFTGSAKEYFGIWIVNVVLSIVTLGIYSAWAKVKRETYFKNNTKIFKTGFGYHATGGQIFKGRLKAFAVLVMLHALSSIYPPLDVALIPVFLFLMPWVLNNSMRFSAHMTSYRNICFNWHGTYWETLWFLVVAPFMGLLSLGVLTPLISKSYYAYFARSHSYGTTRFTSKPEVKDFYYAFLMGGVLPTILFGGVIFALVTIGQGDSGISIWVSMLIALYAFVFSMAFIYSVLCRNLMIKTLTLGEVISFDSTIDPVKFVWISLSNLALTLVSVGLLSPWAQVRMHRYLSESTLIKLDGDIEKFVDENKTVPSSFGEAIADFEGVEVAI